MELSKKTTILFSPELHRQLVSYASRKGVSLGELVREACVAAYGLTDRETRTSAVSALGALSLPVASVKSMKRETQPDAKGRIP